HIAGVVLDDVQHTGARVHAFGRLKHLIRRGRCEDLTSTGRIEHPETDKPAVQWLVTRTATGDQTHLARHGGVTTVDDAVDLVYADLGPGGLDAEQRLANNMLGVVDELFHRRDISVLSPS